MSIAAPTQGRSRTRINWLLRQLGKAPDAVQIEAWPIWARSPGPCKPLAQIRDQPDILIDDPRKELKSFTVRLSATAGTKRGQGRGSFVGSVLSLVDDFYETIGQHVRPWTPPAPTLKPRDTEDDTNTVDGIAGELPTKSVQRATEPPTWEPADQPAQEPPDYRIITVEASDQEAAAVNR